MTPYCLRWCLTFDPVVVILYPYSISPDHRKHHPHLMWPVWDDLSWVLSNHLSPKYCQLFSALPSHALSIYLLLSSPSPRDLSLDACVLTNFILHHLSVGFISLSSIFSAPSSSVLFRQLRGVGSVHQQHGGVLIFFFFYISSLAFTLRWPVGYRKAKKGANISLMDT